MSKVHLGTLADSKHHRQLGKESPRTWDYPFFVIMMVTSSTSSGLAMKSLLVALASARRTSLYVDWPRRPKQIARFKPEELPVHLTAHRRTFGPVMMYRASGLRSQVSMPAKMSVRRRW